MSLKDKKFADVYFCGDEDDGHAKKNKWFKTWRPSEYDAEDDDNDQYWYSIDKNGKVYIPSQSNASKLAYGVKYKKMLSLRLRIAAQQSSSQRRT